MRARALAVHVVQFWLFALAIVSGYANTTAAENKKSAQIPIKDVNVPIKNVNVFVRIILVSVVALGWSPGGPAWAGQIDSTEAAAGLLEAQKTFRRLKAYRPAAHPPKRSPGALEKGSGRQCH